MLRAKLTKPALVVAGTHACAAGVIKLVVREFSSSNTATAD
jgi:hypothetical protein